MIGRITEFKKMKSFIYLKVQNAYETAHIQLGKDMEPRPHTNDIIQFDMKDIGEQLPIATNLKLLEKCKAPEEINPDATKIILHRQKIEQIIDSHYKNINAIKVITPTLENFRGTSNVEPYETINKKSKKLYLKFTHDLALRNILADALVPVYEIGNVFRNMGASYKYATEFTMLESHIPCESLEFGIQFATNILQDIAHYLGKDDFDNLEQKSIFDSFYAFGKDFYQMGIIEQMEFYKDSIKKSGTFISAYQPIDAAPLAKIDPNTGLALDAEIIHNGKGIAHIYVCENNYDKLLQIFKSQGHRQQDLNQDFLNKLKAGIPTTVGVAIGLDRTIAGLHNINVNDLVVRKKLSREQ